MFPEVMSLNRFQFLISQLCLYILKQGNIHGKVTELPLFERYLNILMIIVLSIRHQISIC